MKKNIRNLPESIKSRLRNKAKESNRLYSEVLQYYCIERFLYRLSCSKYAKMFILKGALMFIVWEIPERRTTLDIDFLADYDNRVTAIEEVIKKVCLTSVIPDGLVFDPETVKGQSIREEMEYKGVRIKFLGLLERSRIPMQIDVGFGDVVYPKPKVINYPVILDFPEPNLKGYPVESMVTEKFEAMVKLGLLNSRMKDFYDIWILIHQFDFNGRQLVEALKKTFKCRNTAFPKTTPILAEEIYDEKSDRQTLWKAFLSKNDITHAPEKLCNIALEIEKFFIKPLNAIDKKLIFNEIWKALGPWKSKI
ncbi:nucleotidyl transferase AbiEii/AbiGii toxin family protein [Candidatus Dependentiae bacterium]|nr:nucleotidyl transferase AbiEii/AbiGii toxin family protein [Candidatus Dependentiae bacterium]